MKKLLRSSVATGLLFCVAVILLFAGSIGGTQAALQQYSEEYHGLVSMRNIGVTLIENGKDVSYRNYDTVASGNWDEHTGYLVETMVADAGDSSLKIGKTYPFALSIRNSGEIDQYARVTIYKYWVDANGRPLSETGWFDGKGNKQLEFDPALIEIELANGGVWVEDTGSRTEERTVLYYQGILTSGEESAPFTSTLTINGKAAQLVSQVTDENGNMTSEYRFAADGIGFVVEAQVDAVQTHNMENALPSAWGQRGSL